MTESILGDFAPGWGAIRSRISLRCLALMAPTVMMPLTALPQYGTTQLPPTRTNDMSEYCKYCGQEYRDAATLLRNTCNHHPIGPYKGKHALFEGDTCGPFYCVYCGQMYTSLRTLLLNTCMHNPNGRNHEAYDGDISGTFRCTFCGREYKDIHTMVMNTCQKNPTRGGHHSPAR